MDTESQKVFELVCGSGNQLSWCLHIFSTYFLADLLGNLDTDLFRDINTFLNWQLNGNCIRHLFADLLRHIGAHGFWYLPVGVHTMFLRYLSTVGNFDNLGNLNRDFVADGESDVGAFGSTITTNKTTDITLVVTMGSITSLTIMRHVGTDLSNKRNKFMCHLVKQDVTTLSMAFLL